MCLYCGLSVVYFKLVTCIPILEKKCCGSLFLYLYKHAMNFGKTATLIQQFFVLVQIVLTWYYYILGSKNAIIGEKKYSNWIDCSFITYFIIVYYAN